MLSRCPGESEAAELSNFTPSFLWLLRDFYLTLEEEGRTVRGPCSSAVLLEHVYGILKLLLHETSNSFIIRIEGKKGGTEIKCSLSMALRS